MTSPTKLVRPWSRLRVTLGVMALLALGASASVDAQVVQGVEKGAREGNKAAGPVGGVLGGAIGGVVGVVTGVTGVLTGGANKGGQPQGQQPAAKDAKQGDAASRVSGHGQRLAARRRPNVSRARRRSRVAGQGRDRRPS